MTVKHADPYLRDLGLSQVRLMKMDVEGHEEQVLRGATAFFERTPPQVVVFEHNRYETPFWEHPVIQFLSSRGYMLASVTPRTKFAPELRIMQPSSDAVDGHDFVAIYDGPERAAILKALRAR